MSFELEGDGIVPAERFEADPTYWFCSPCGDEMLEVREQMEAITARRNAGARERAGVCWSLEAMLVSVKSLTAGMRRGWR